MLWNDVHFFIVDQNIPPTEPRIPQRQLLIEMAAMIKQHVRDLMGTDVKSVIRPLKKYSPQYNEANIPHTEIILYEDEETDLTRSSFQQTRQWVVYNHLLKMNENYREL